MDKTTNNVPHWFKPLKLMEHNGNSGSIGGLIATVLLWIVAKITLSDLASFATIMSGCIVFLVNLPKIIALYQKYFKKKA